MSFQIALSALQAFNSQLDNISQNIANTGTTGYKSSRTNFAAMYASSTPNGVQAASSTQTLDISGGLLSTGRGLDVAISGKGYFMTTDSTGVTNYTRAGIFDIDNNGNLVDHLGRNVQGYAMGADSSTLGALGTVNVPTGQIPAQASTQLEYVGNLSADWPAKTNTFNPADPSSYNSSTVSVVFDSLGAEHTVTQYFRRTEVRSVPADPSSPLKPVIEVHYSFDGTPLAGQKVELPFDSEGQLLSPNHQLALTPSNGSNPITLGISYAGTTQFAGDTTTTTNAPNGYASGTMVNVQVDKDGAVNVQYSNGKIQRVGMVALASFRSESGLVAVDGTSWQASAQSGVALVGTPGTGQFGQLASQQLEQSNVEVATELVDLMGAQRNYQANTKVISTQNDIMQSLMQVM